MSMKINITAPPGGSNPGGKCHLIQDGSFSEFDCYMKYCNSSTLPSNIPFKYSHQPFYEALLFAMAEKVGLTVPPYAVIDNRKKNISFSYMDDKLKKLNENMPFFFVSKLISTSVDEILEKSPDHSSTSFNEQFNREKVLRDLIYISDIEHKPNNYAHIFEPDGEMKVAYLDLGCSFIYVTSGVMSLKGKFDYLNNKKQINDAFKKIKNMCIQKPYNKGFIGLEELLQSIPELKIKLLNPERTVTLNKCLEKNELDYIQNVMLAHMSKIVSSCYKECAKIVELSHRYVIKPSEL